MMNSSRRHPVFIPCIGAAMVGLSACSTQEISPEPLLIPDTTPSADHGELTISFAPREVSFEEQQANAAAHTTTFHAFFDGKQLAWSSSVDGSLQALIVGEGGTSRIGYLPAGSHHFEIRAADRGPTAFAGDGEIAAGSRTELYLFGPAGGVQGRFVSYPAVVAAGTAHVVLINMVRSGQRIEAVGCVDLSNCAPLSAPLALGEVFAADVPMDATQDWPTGRYILSDGAALGYRQVPTAAVPAPPVLPLPNSLPDAMNGSPPSGAVLAAAPVYMSPAGDIQASF
jgi:hypothetical protein